MKYISNKPIYIQIAHNIVLDLYTKELPLASLLPSVRELSITYNVTPKTIQAVTKYLADNLIIIKKASVGSVITNTYEIIEKLHYKHGKENTKEYIKQMTLLSYKDEDILQIVQNTLKELKYDKN